MKAKLKMFNEILSWVLLVAVSCLLVFSVFTAVEAKKTGEGAFLFGYRPVFVLTGSMEPYMMTNSLALTKQVTSIDELEVGDVVTYHMDTDDSNRILITHRIINIEDGKIYTKGDNNRVDDGFALTIDNIEAEVVTVFNQTAWLISKWQTPSGKVMIISGVICFILCYISIRMWITSIRDGRKCEDKESLTVEQAKSSAEVDS